MIVASRPSETKWYVSDERTKVLMEWSSLYVFIALLVIRFFFFFSMATTHEMKHKYMYTLACINRLRGTYKGEQIVSRPC